MVTVSADRFRSLKEAANFLGRLQAAGVDNWEGYPGDPDDEEDDW